MSLPLVIAPSILSADFGRLADEVRAADRAGADWIHLDVMDGHFVPNLTIGSGVVRSLRAVTRLPLDVHLMVEAPERHIDAFASAGADRITVHEEATTHLQRVLASIRERGLKAGVALNPSTPVEAVGEVLADLDLLLVMTVNPGFPGQSFIEGSVEKVRRARALLREAALEDRIPIQVDGGIDLATAPRVTEAGATVLVAGSSLYGAKDGIAAALPRLREAAGTVRG